MKLYNLERSGNCYKIRLFLSILKLEYTGIAVNVAEGENSSTEFLAMNPNGLLPVLVDEDITIYDSAAILCYLAKNYADEHWLPQDKLQFPQVIRWLAFEQSEGRYGLARARAIKLNIPGVLSRMGTLEESQRLGNQALDIMNKQLSQTQWLAGGPEPSICDLACYPYTALCNEGDLSLEPFREVSRWIKDIEKLDGYISLPKS